MAQILLVEPDAVLARTYIRALEFSGHQIRLTVSAQDAVFKVDELIPDVVIVELQLVAHSGIEFLYELRSYSEWQRVPVIIHSCIPPAEFSDSIKLLRDQLGVSVYLYKPHTSLQALLRAVHEACQPPNHAAIPAISRPLHRSDGTALAAQL
jgi:two-component system phosphate regulon response regulator PhoB